MRYSPPGDCTFFLITRASLSVTSIFKKVLADEELSEVKPSYLGVLMCLWENEAMDEILSKLGSEDGMKLTALGRCAGVEPSTITGLVDRMERDGLVYRSNDPDDRRAQKANLTEKGRLIRARVFNALDKMEEGAFAGIAPEEMDAAKKVLWKVLENANKKKK
jgi:DNA-binding MarR family transcriptional regulator